MQWWCTGRGLASTWLPTRRNWGRPLWSTWQEIKVSKVSPGFQSLTVVSPCTYVPESPHSPRASPAPHSLHCPGGRITWKLEMGTRDSNFAISQLPNRRIADITTHRRVANRDGSDGISKTKTEIVDRSWHSDFSSLPVHFPQPHHPSRPAILDHDDDLGFSITPPILEILFQRVRSGVLEVFSTRPLSKQTSTTYSTP